MARPRFTFPAGIDASPERKRSSMGFLSAPVTNQISARAWFNTGKVNVMRRKPLTEADHIMPTGLTLFGKKDFIVALQLSIGWFYNPRNTRRVGMLKVKQDSFLDNQWDRIRKSIKNPCQSKPINFKEHICGVTNGRVHKSMSNHWSIYYIGCMRNGYARGIHCSYLCR